MRLVYKQSVELNKRQKDLDVKRSQDQNRHDNVAGSDFSFQEVLTCFPKS